MKRALIVTCLLIPAAGVLVWLGSLLVDKIAEWCKPAPPPPDKWVCVWEEEFDGGRPFHYAWGCESKMGREPGDAYVFTPDAVRMKNGVLVITSDEKTTPNPHYSEPRKMSGNVFSFPGIKEKPYMSGCVTTIDRQGFKGPGRLEIRAKLPEASGAGPFIQIAHAGKIYGFDYTVDLVTYIPFKPGVVYSRISPGGRQSSFSTEVPTCTTEFHTYTLQWVGDLLTIMIDGNEVGSTRAPGWNDSGYVSLDNRRTAEERPCYITIGTNINFQHYPASDCPAEYPVHFEIDSVRFYTLESALNSQK